MKLKNPLSALVLLLLISVGCKVKPPSSTNISADQIDPRDSVSIEAFLIDDVEEIETFSVIQDTITVIGVGDMMLGTNFPDIKYLPPDSGKYLLANIKSVLTSGDITFGNLEGVILNDGGDPKNCKNPDICYLFRSPEYIMTQIQEAGFDLLSVANNHSGDFGTPGRANTARVLDSLGIVFAGSILKPYTIFEKKKIRYGFAAFSPNKGTPQITEIEKAKATIVHLDSLTDVVIVSFHGGAEGKDYMNISDNTEYFYGENRGNVYNFSHELIDSGADIIFGHGPHVPRAIEVYKKRFIAYSLGNFCTYARFNLQGESGLAPIAKVYVDQEGEFLSGQIISAIQSGLGVPIIDTKNRAAELILKLMQEDFKEAQIIIDRSGVITYIQE